MTPEGNSMPIYSYQCKCGATTDVVHPMSEEPKVKCDECKAVMSRKFAVPNIRFNGSGFYSTDK